MTASSAAPSSASTATAFLPAEPTALAERTRQLLTPGDQPVGLDENEHLISRLGSVVADWITQGQVEKLSAWADALREDAQRMLAELTERRGLEPTEVQALRAVFLTEFVRRFADTDSVAKAVSTLLAPKRANWRRALVLMVEADAPWHLRDFQEKAGVKRSAAHDALTALTGQGLLQETDAGHGKRTFSLTPYGRQVARRLGRQELGTDRGHGDAQARVSRLQVEIKSAQRKSGSPFPPEVMRYHLPGDLLELYFSGKQLQAGLSWAAPAYYSQTTGLYDPATRFFEHSYGSYFATTLERWLRSRVAIEESLWQHSRRECMNWLATQPEAVLNSYHPLLVAAAGPKFFRRMVRLIKAHRPRHGDKAQSYFFVIFSSIYPEKEVRITPDILSHVTNAAHLTKTLCFRYLPAVAKTMHERKLIASADVDVLVDYWRDIMRSTYPEDYDVFFSQLGAVDPTTPGQVHFTVDVPRGVLPRHQFAGGRMLEPENRLAGRMAAAVGPPAQVE